MGKLRVAILTVAAATTFLGSTDPGRALLDYDTRLERVVTTGFHFGEGTDRIEVTIEGVARDGVAGADASAGEATLSEACVTVDRPGREQATQTFCGPAQVEIDPLLETASVTGTFHGIDFVLDFAASGGATPSADPPTLFGTSAGFSRSGSATAQLLGELFGDAEIQGSSWYAEVKEKVKTTATPK